MNKSFLDVEDTSLSKEFIFSALIHLSCGLILWGLSRIVFIPHKTAVIELVNSSVRVDLVGMPKASFQELKNLQGSIAETSSEESAPREESPTKEEVSDDPNAFPSQKKSLTSLISQYSGKKIKPIINSKKSNEGGKGNSELKQLVVEGNKISKGKALVGDFTGEYQGEFAEYIQEIPEAIKPYWKLPSYLLNQDLKCRIKIYIGRQGQLLSLSIMESSGNQDFDARAVGAVRGVVKFPMPSQNIGSQLEKTGVVLGFPL